MSTGRRITLTVGAGLLLGVATVVAEDQAFPTAAANAAIDLPLGILAAIVLLAAPVVVARPWILLSMAGPALALLLLQAADVQVTLDDGTGPAINYRTIFQFGVLCAVMLVAFGVRSLFLRPQSDQPG